MPVLFSFEVYGLFILAMNPAKWAVLMRRSACGGKIIMGNRR